MRKDSKSDLVPVIQKAVEEASKAVDRAWETLQYEREQAKQSEVLTADKACRQIEQGIAEGKISSPKPSETPKIVKDSRADAINIMQNYIRDSIEGKNRHGTHSKFPILGTSGMKGIGKTTMLEYGLAKVLPDLKMSAKGAYLTFNGGSADSANVFWESQNQQNTALRSVGHVLMANLKVEAKQYSLLDFEQCLNLFRKALGMSGEESLVLFIDEIGELKKQADDVLKASMSAADARGGKLVFVFAHISQQFLDHAATGSGREVIALPLAALPIDTWKQKKDWKKDIPRWFNFVAEDSLKPALRRDGLLLMLPHDKDTEFFPPLVLRDWARRNANDRSLAYHLQQAYAADAVLGSDTEKKMEPLMYHYEAVLRKAAEGKTFTLKQFYKSEHVSDQLMASSVKAKVLPQDTLVEFVKDFSDHTRVLGLLQTGFIVVSEFHSEYALEYVSPFRDASDDTLTVACVQCKFVRSTVSWSGIKTKMADATKWLKQKKIKCLPVIYTAADQNSVKQETYAGGIYFNETDMFQFTKRLGVLRLHTQKLGKNMEQTHKWLSRASSNPDL
ncbi:unnamed protein product [Symbiodinium microadriaticum]|nr:unnamed protein product [Symbiodinium microadriaticum]